MNFTFSVEEEEFREEIRNFVRENLPEDHIGYTCMDEHSDELWAFSMSISRKMAEKGWLCMHWPKEYGGQNASLWKRTIYIEEAGYWGIPGTWMGVSGTGWVGPALMRFGTDEQKKKYLPYISSGHEDGIWCTGYSEPDAGSDFGNIQTRAELKGDHYIVNGQKIWNSAGHRARWCWLAVCTNPDAKKHKGLSVLLVDMKSKGVTVRPIPNIIGIKYFNEIFFDNVEVPVENLVGKENDGWNIVMTALSFERGFAVFTQLGSCRRILDELVAYTKETGLIKRPEIRLRLAEIAIDIHILGLFCYETVWLLEKGKKVIAEPARDKAFSDDVLERLAIIGTEIIGAYSEIRSLDEKDQRLVKVKGILEYLYWLLPGLKNAAGTTDTMKNIVAQMGLGLPRPY